MADADVTLTDAPPVEKQRNGEHTSDQEPTTNGNGTSQQSSTVNLEAVFDDDSDAEFPSSTPARGSSSSSSPPASSPPQQSSAPTQSERYSDPQIMSQFYSRLFPFRPLFQWLNHSPRPQADFMNREFALTLQNDAYLRYQSYATGDALRKDIIKINPSRFEVGPVYSTNPRDRKTLRKQSAFRPVSKEIVFDIDLTDYDDVRTCCDKANICLKCWGFATVSIKVIDRALREDFGFEHVMWVYSGRRGVHAWISDKQARELDDDRRRAITGYFEVIKGGTQSGKRVNVKRPLHPHLQRSLEVLRPFFARVLEEQDPFASQAGYERLLQLLPDKVLNEALRKKWESSPGRSSSKKWADIDAVAATGVSIGLDTKALMEAKQDILLEYTYPRLDVEVGKKRNHLLKSPFVVHPGTGRVCVPITINAEIESRQVDDFDPLNVPKVTELLAEVDAWKGGDDDGYVMEGSAMKKLQDFEKTSLRPHVDRFDRYVKSIIKSEMKLKREREDDGVDGMEF